MNRFRYNQFLLFLVGIIILGSLLFTIIGQKNQKKLQVYEEPDSITTQMITTEEKQIDTFLFENEQYGFSIELPLGWDKVVKDGFDTYIHTPSASSIQIQVLPYEPSINLVSPDTLSTELVEKGYVFVDFIRNTTSSYELLYQDQGEVLYDYIEEVFWSRDCLVKIICVFNDSNAQKLHPYYEKVIKSFTWNTTNIIPNNLYLYYNEMTDFEVAIPSDWTVGYSGNSLVAVNMDNTAQMTVTVSEYNNTLDKITATDMSNLVKPNKNSFMLKEFSTSPTKAVAKSTYNNGTPATNYTYMYSNGIYLYMVQFDYFTGTIDENIIFQCDSMFREFLTQKIIEESEVVESNNSTPTDATPIDATLTDAATPTESTQ